MKQYSVYMFEMVAYKDHEVCTCKKTGNLINTLIHNFEGVHTSYENIGHKFLLNYCFATFKGWLCRIHHEV